MKRRMATLKFYEYKILLKIASHKSVSNQSIQIGFISTLNERKIHFSLFHSWEWHYLWKLDIFFKQLRSTKTESNIRFNEKFVLSICLAWCWHSDLELFDFIIFILPELVGFNTPIFNVLCESMWIEIFWTSLCLQYTNINAGTQKSKWMLRYVQFSVILYLVREKRIQMRDWITLKMRSEWEKTKRHEMKLITNTTTITNKLKRILVSLLSLVFFLILWKKPAKRQYHFTATGSGHCTVQKIFSLPFRLDKMNL